MTYLFLSRVLLPPCQVTTFVPSRKKWAPLNMMDPFSDDKSSKLQNSWMRLRLPVCGYKKQCNRLMQPSWSSSSNVSASVSSISVRMCNNLDCNKRMILIKSGVWWSVCFPDRSKMLQIRVHTVTGHLPPIQDYGKDQIQVTFSDLTALLNIESKPAKMKMAPWAK